MNSLNSGSFQLQLFIFQSEVSVSQDEPVFEKKCSGLVSLKNKIIQKLKIKNTFHILVIMYFESTPEFLVYLCKPN